MVTFIFTGLSLIQIALFCFKKFYFYFTGLSMNTKHSTSKVFNFIWTVQPFILIGFIFFVFSLLYKFIQKRSLIFSYATLTLSLLESFIFWFIKYLISSFKTRNHYKSYFIFLIYFSYSFSFKFFLKILKVLWYFFLILIDLILTFFKYFREYSLLVLPIVP
ncbi:hypothetical protein BANRA_03861 [Acinetobacter baumannii]|nr:hypothetical protein BANRA_03861 [Acinetobacter baumannii]